MAINPTDPKIRPAAPQRTEHNAPTETKAPEAARVQKPEAAKSTTSARDQQDSFSTLQRQGGGAARRNVSLADAAASIKEQRRAARASSGAGAQLIGDSAPSLAPPAARVEVLSLNSPDAQKAIKTTLEYINQNSLRQNLGGQGAQAQGAPLEYTPRNVERDELGMTHVRMDRQHEGVRVFGEQVVSHLDSNGVMQGLTGDAAPIPVGKGTEPVAVGQEQALKMAAQDFGSLPDRAPTAQRVVAKGPDGEYHSAWHVQMFNLSEKPPRHMNYLIDAQSGKLMEKYNQIDSIEIRKAKAAKPLAVEGSAAPNATIPDQGTVNSSIKIDQDVDIQKLKLNLDIDHTYSGDLKVTLTSPSGKSVVVKDRVGGDKDNIKESIDLSQFNGESSKGEWKLLVQDSAAKDTGKLNKWSLNIDGVAKTPPPAPGTVDSVTKTATPNAPIKDNTTATSTIDVPEEFDIDKFNLNLDIAHTYKGDLKVTLTSPSGKTAVVHDHTGGSTDNVTGQFDLSSAFAGEKVKGPWKLSVEDNARQDEGTLKSWGFTATAKNGKPPEPGTTDDKTLYSGNVKIDSTKNADGTYRLEDSTRGKGIATFDAKGSQRPTNRVNINDNNDKWGESTDPAANRAAVDAQYGSQSTYDFYKNVLGRDSIDGQGERLDSFVHVGSNYVNAFWDGEKMNYGDGDGREAGPLTTLDIAGHEISHGLTERTAGLIYSGESGGLNEAMSDILGTGVEWFASQKNQNVKFDWSVGEDAWTPTNGDPTDALRYMNDPTKDGYSIDNYKDYPRQTEVHGSSGIANNAFYLLANGGTNKTSGQTVPDGIGMEKSLKVYYRALAYYMTPRTTFSQAREATIKAATDLYGATSTEVQRVKDSWGAVGVA